MIRDKMISEDESRNGGTLHSECGCCEYAAKRITKLEALLREVDAKVIFETAVMDGSGQDLQERIEAALGIGLTT